MDDIWYPATQLSSPNVDNESFGSHLCGELLEPLWGESSPRKQIRCDDDLVLGTISREGVSA